MGMCEGGAGLRYLLALSILVTAKGAKGQRFEGRDILILGHAGSRMRAHRTALGLCTDGGSVIGKVEVGSKSGPILLIPQTGIN